MSLYIPLVVDTSNDNLNSTPLDPGGDGAAALGFYPQRAGATSLSLDTSVGIYRDGANNIVFRDVPSGDVTLAYLISDIPTLAAAAQASALLASQKADEAANASRLTVGTVNMLESDGDVAVTITGPAGAQKLNMDIPRGPTGPGGTIGCFGNYYDTTDQQLVEVNVEQLVRIGTTVEQVRMTRSGSGRITFAEDATYSLTFSIQFTNTDNAIHTAAVWLKKNGTTLADSASNFDIPAKKAAINGQLIGTVNFVMTVVAGDYVELWWTGNSTALWVETVDALAPVPAAPAVILTITQVMYTQTADVTPALATLRDTTIAAKDTAVGAASTATTKASNAAASELNALTSANLATEKANIILANIDTATTQAGIATTQAGIATTQAGIATTKASEASSYAAVYTDLQIAFVQQATALVGTQTLLTSMNTNFETAFLQQATSLLQTQTIVARYHSFG